MHEKPKIDVEAAHRFFSAECFNRSWDLIEKADRSPEEDERMLLLSMASLWHWSERPDHTDKNISTGAWQISRIYALLGQAELARAWGLKCLKYSQGEGTLPYNLAYAYEALARAEMVAHDHGMMAEYLARAKEASKTMTDEQTKKNLLDDLATIHL